MMGCVCVGGWGLLLHPSQGHLFIQLVRADLHQQSICTVPDDAAVLWDLGRVPATSHNDPVSHFIIQSTERHPR